jgi:hypothetical protein
MNPAELVLLGLALLGSVFAFAKYVGATKRDRQARRHERLGAANAEREMQTSVVEICVICQRPVEPEIDIFDEKTNTWWHKPCWRESLK